MPEKPSDPKTSSANTLERPAHTGDHMCYYKGVPYSVGSQECMGGHWHRCEADGSWQELSEPAATQGVTILFRGYSTGTEWNLWIHRSRSVLPGSASLTLSRRIAKLRPQPSQVAFKRSGGSPAGQRAID